MERDDFSGRISDGFGLRSFMKDFLGTDKYNW